MLSSRVGGEFGILRSIVCIKGHRYVSSSEVRLSKIWFYNDNLQDPKNAGSQERGPETLLGQGVRCCVFVYVSCRHRGEGIDE
jgi:hypothetical protein